MSKNGKKFMIAGIVSTLITIIFVLWIMIPAPANTSPESYEIRGNLMMMATIFAPIVFIFVFIATMVLAFIVSIGEKRSNSEWQEPPDEPSTKT